MLPLAKLKIALAEGRQLEELAGMLEKEGATPLRYPLVSILDAPDEQPVLDWLEEVANLHFSHVIFLTGEGVRRLLACADRHNMRERVIAGLAHAQLITRGPKPGRALKEFGLAPAIVARAPTSSGVVESLRSLQLAGQIVGVQLYSDTNTALVDFIRTSGAVARTVQPYVFAAASDSARVEELIDEMSRGKVDVIIFTSSPQVDRLFEVATERGLTDKLAKAFTKTKTAAVGPIVAERLKRGKAKVDICPEQGFVMKNLVQLIKKVLGKDE